jgi:hypothetical protein
MKFQKEKSERNGTGAKRLLNVFNLKLIKLIFKLIKAIFELLQIETGFQLSRNSTSALSIA